MELQLEITVMFALFEELRDNTSLGVVIKIVYLLINFLYFRILLAAPTH